MPEKKRLFAAHMDEVGFMVTSVDGEGYLKVKSVGGIENAVKTALKNCGKMIPWQVVTITTDGKIIKN